ncbi:hypothetical protein AJ87_17415 [Rhizobium yanglingense]|nr:hypothetical protein AJ87_17415 [Rhizobium yanglingense]
MIEGSVASPVTSTVSVVVPEVELASISSAGVKSPANVMRLLSVKFRRRLSMVKRPRRMVKPPETTGVAAVPLIVTLPPSSESMPRPRTKIFDGALICRSSASVVDFSPAFCAFSSRSWARTAGGAFTCLMLISRSEVGSLSGTVIDAFSTFNLPLSTGLVRSGPRRPRLPSTVATTSVPST